MSRLTWVFQKPRHIALIPYVTVGYPSIEATLKIVPLLARSGCDIIELGIPFSDPLADGATIQKASFHALRNGVTPQICLEVAEKLRRQVDSPLVFMTYFNPILNYGLEEFCLASARAGVDGLIIPDLPPDEGTQLEALSQKHKLDLVYLLTPTRTEGRIRLIAQKSRGFIYVVSITGVTGAREVLPPELEVFVAKVRGLTDKPLCVGFGISTIEQAKRIAQVADGVIVGSRIIQLMEADDDFTSACDFIKGLRVTLDEVALKEE